MHKKLLALTCILATTLAVSQQSSADPVAHTLTLSQTTPVADEFVGSLSIDNAELSPNLFVLSPVNLLNFDITVNGVQYGLADLQPFFKVTTNCVGEIIDISALFSDGSKPDLTFAPGDWDQREFISRSLIGGGLRYTADRDIPTGIVPEATLILATGPFRSDGMGGFESFDIDGDGFVDTGNVVGLGLNDAQHYAYEIDITSDCADSLPEVIALTTISATFTLDPDLEDFTADGPIDGICSDGLPCDGIIADPTCPVTITEPPNGAQAISATLLIEAGGLAASSTCTTTVFVATQQASGGKGKGKKRAKFEPASCVTAVSDSGIQITDTIALNHGVKVFDGTTNDLLAGPIDSIQLTPIGCP